MNAPDIRVSVATNYGGLAEQYADLWKSQLAKIKARFDAATEKVLLPGEHPVDVPIVYVKKESITGVLSFMKTEQGLEYGFLSDITATDEEPSEFRFEVVYNLYSMTSKARIRVKTRVREGEEVPTSIPIWPGANWAEREIWDMFGVRFTGHPDLRRILMDERWEGHPLRKDYPLRGYQVFTESMQINQKLLD